MITIQLLHKLEHYNDAVNTTSVTAVFLGTFSQLIRIPLSYNSVVQCVALI